MPVRGGTKAQGPTLYQTFVDAYMKARPDVKRSVRNLFSEKPFSSIDFAINERFRLDKTSRCSKRMERNQRKRRIGQRKN